MSRETKADRRTIDLPQPAWDDPDRSLSEILDHCLKHAKGYESWYMRKRTPKRIWGRILRAASVLLIGAGVLIPILAQVYTRNGEPVIAPGWASLALVLAATMVALDRLFGFSTGWTRFIETSMQLARLRHDFEFEWQALRVELGSSGPDSALLLELAREFVLAVDDVVAAEVLAWSEETRASLDTATDRLKAGA
jgi:hypothetical protein